MDKRRKAIRLSPDERELLKTLHRQSRVPDGQFPQRPRMWRHLTDVWNIATGRNDTPEEVLHYIVTQRKQGLWFRFEGTHKRLSVPEVEILSPEEWEVVDAIYIEFNIGSDNFLFDKELRQDILNKFMAQTGRHLPDLLFIAALIARRKSGDLPRTGPDNDDLGFRDIDEVG